MKTAKKINISSFNKQNRFLHFALNYRHLLTIYMDRSIKYLDFIYIIMH